MTVQPPYSPAALDPLAELLSARAGIRVRGRGLTKLAQYAAHRMAALDIPDTASFCARLEASDDEFASLLDAVLNPGSYFFRNAALWEHIGAVLLPKLARDGRAAKRPGVRAWCAAASDGAEPYALAMLSSEHAPADPTSQIQIVGTDLSESALCRARAARYPRAALTRVAPPRRLRHFISPDGGEHHIVRDHLRPLVTFARHDLRRPFATEPFDLVLLRNVLQHLNDEAQLAALHSATGALRPGGYLILGDVTPASIVANLRNAGALHEVHSLIYEKQAEATPPPDHH